MRPNYYSRLCTVTYLVVKTEPITVERIQHNSSWAKDVFNY